MGKIRAAFTIRFLREDGKDGITYYSSPSSVIIPSTAEEGSSKNFDVVNIVDMDVNFYAVRGSDALTPRMATGITDKEGVTDADLTISIPTTAGRIHIYCDGTYATGTVQVTVPFEDSDGKVYTHVFPLSVVPSIAGENGTDGKSVGNNLLNGTGFVKNTSYWNEYDGTVSDSVTPSGKQIYYDNASGTTYHDILRQTICGSRTCVDAGKWYTLSFYAKGKYVYTYLYPGIIDSSAGIYVDGVLRTSGSDGYVSFALSGSYVRHSVSFLIKSTPDSGDNYVLFRIPAAQSAYISSPKLENGKNTTTEWCLSEDDKIGDTGLGGCVIRTTEWMAGREYRNDSDITDRTVVRYIDCAVVTSGTSYSAFMCIKTHTGSSSITTDNKLYWQDMNVTFPIMTPFIVVQQALIKYLQVQQLVVTDANGNVEGAFGGGNDYILWAGASTVADAPYKLHRNGSTIQNNAFIKGTIAERYTFVNRGTLNIIDFNSINNVAVNKGIDNSPAMVVLPMYEAYNGGNISTSAYVTPGTSVSIMNTYNVAMKNWKEAATLLDGQNKNNLRYQLNAAAVYIISDPRIIAYNNYTGDTPTIMADGSANSNDTIDYRKGRMFCNGKSARIAMILPGQILRLQSAVETYTDAEGNTATYLVWYVVNGSEYTTINKYMIIQGRYISSEDRYIYFGTLPSTANPTFKAVNTYSNWGESGVYDLDQLIAPKELDCRVVNSSYETQEPIITFITSESGTAPCISVVQN